jgi:hypothetical protein
MVHVLDSLLAAAGVEVLIEVGIVEVWFIEINADESALNARMCFPGG